MNFVNLTAAILLLAGILSSGCGKGDSTAPKPTNTASSGNPITAPVDYLGAINQAQKRAGKVISTAGLDQAIKMYQATEGKFPPSLNALVPDYLHSIPAAPNGMNYTYDPATGVIKVDQK